MPWKECTRCHVGFFDATQNSRCKSCQAVYRAARKEKGGFKCHSCHKVLAPGESHNNQCKECHAEYEAIRRSRATEAMKW